MAFLNKGLTITLKDERVSDEELELEAIAEEGETAALVEEDSFDDETVVESDAETWLRLATGDQRWAEALADGRLRVSGTRADLDALLPLTDPDPAGATR